MTQAAYTKVFLTWSGDRSKAMATALRDWLPSVIQALDPWMSDSDIAKGAGWNSEISKQLELAKIGIVCLTPENLDAPWVNFEAGALSKLPGSFVCTYLLGLSSTDLTGPLTQFQWTESDDKEDTKKLLRDINDKLGEQSLKGPTFDSVFEKWWPDLDKALRAIPASPEEDKRVKRAPEELLEEILQLARDQDKKSDMALQALNALASTGALERLIEGRVIPRFGFGGNVAPYYGSTIEGSRPLWMDAAASGFASTEEVAQLAAQQAKQNTAAIAADTASKKKDGEK